MLKWHYIVIASVQITVFLCGQIIKASVPCEGSIKCLSFITETDCMENEYLEIDLTLGCCPTCRGGLGFGVAGCNPTNPRRKCAPGLECVDGACLLNKHLCSYTYHLKHLMNLPTCEMDGTFAAKQCKGDMVSGRCFCYNEQGNRIFGFDWRKNAENMTCACSRHRSMLEASGRIDVTIHCSSNGNYEELQCDSGACWCAEPKTGRIVNGTRAVPNNMWTILPCYNIDTMGTQYLRECESAAYSQKMVRKSVGIRGTLDVSYNNILCDYDGSYGIYKIENGIASCTWRDGTRIGSYQDGANWVSEMNCYCARDQKEFEVANLGFTLSCRGNGNYNSIQGINGRIFCVDDEGFSVTGYFNSTYGVECNEYIYSKITEPLDE